MATKKRAFINSGESQTNVTGVQRLAQENRSLFKRIQRWLRGFVQSVRRAFRGVSASSYEARLLEKAEGMQKLWDDALVKAMENVQQAQRAETTAPESSDVKFSRRTSRDINLTEEQLARFYEKVGEIQTGKSKQFKKARTGHFIFAIDNKLVYTNGDFEKPSVHKVVDINLEDETDIDVVRQIIFKWEERECSGEQARRFLENMYGKRVVDGHNFEVHRSNAGENGRRKGKVGGSVYRGSETAVSEETLNNKYSLRNQDRTVRDLLLTAADRYARNKPQQELLGRYRAKAEELANKREELEKVRKDIRKREKAYLKDPDSVTTEGFAEHFSALMCFKTEKMWYNLKGCFS